MSIERREVLKTGLAAVAASVLISPAAAAGQGGSAKPAQEKTPAAGERAAADKTPAGDQPGKAAFKLKYAPHFGMFAGHAGGDPIDQLKFMAERGFTAMEDNGMGDRPAELQVRIGQEMARLGMTMGVFVINPKTAWKCSFANGDAKLRDEFLAECRNAVEVAKRVNAKWGTVVPGTLDPGLEMGFQTANVIDTLRRAAEILEPHKLVMVLEALNPWRDHPGMFLSKIPQAFMICRAVNSPSCKILFDMYHQQISEGNIIPNIDRAWSEVAYFQIGDNPGRNEPTSGEMNYRNIFRHIHAKGFAGVLGMEHGNSKPGKEGESAVIEAYRRCDEF